MKTRCKCVRERECVWEREKERDRNQLPQSIYFALHSFLLISSLIMLCMESDIDRYELGRCVRSGRCAGEQITLLLIHKCRDERLQQNHLLEVELTDTHTERERELNTVTKELCGAGHSTQPRKQITERERDCDYRICYFGWIGWEVICDVQIMSKWCLWAGSF